MSEQNKSILLKGNAAISAGNNQGFIDLCAEDTSWEFVGEKTIIGKQAVSAYLNETYPDPPKFSVKDLIAEGEFVIAVGEIELKQKDGTLISYDYCDVWRFAGDKIAGLRGFVIPKK